MYIHPSHNLFSLVTPMLTYYEDKCLQSPKFYEAKYCVCHSPCKGTLSQRADFNIYIHIYIYGYVVHVCRNLSNKLEIIYIYRYIKYIQMLIESNTSHKFNIISRKNLLLSDIIFTVYIIIPYYIY